jgi:hypothetical protein
MVALGVLLLLVLGCFCSSIIADQYNSPSSPYAYIVAKQNHRSLHRWDEVIVSVLNDTAHREIIRKEVLSPGIVPPSYFVPQPVYVSMTTISIRIDSIYKSVLILIQGRIVPTHIYLCISEEPFLLDKGITSIPDNLLSLVAAKYLTIVYTQNIGSHRKLLPVLKRYWGQDVFIATLQSIEGVVQELALAYLLIDLDHAWLQRIMSLSQLFRVLHAHQVPNCTPAIGQRSLNLLHTLDHRLIVILNSALAPSLTVLGFAEYGLKVGKILFEFIQIEFYSRQDVLCLQLAEQRSGVLHQQRIAEACLSCMINSSGGHVQRLAVHVVGLRTQTVGQYRRAHDASEGL